MNEGKAVIGSLGLVAGVTFNGCILDQHHRRNKLPVSLSRLEAQASGRIFIKSIQTRGGADCPNPNACFPNVFQTPSNAESLNRNSVPCSPRPCPSALPQRFRL